MEGNKMKQFNKFQFLKIVAPLNFEFNPETLEFKSSPVLHLRSWLILFVKSIVPFKVYYSTLFERKSIVQLWIGNMYNYLPDAGRLSIGYTAMTIIPWEFYIYYVFNYAIAPDDFRKWLKLTYEVSAKNDNNYRVPGLPRQENKRFWLSEDQNNACYFRVANFFIAFVCTFVELQLFLVPLWNLAPLWLYILVQFFHILLISSFIYLFLHSVYTTNWFFLGAVTFFAKKISYIAKQVRLMIDASKVKRVNNRKLARLINEYNQTQVELIETNNFFKKLIGVNVVMFFVFGNMGIFTAFNSNWIAKVAFYSVVVTLFVTMIYLPFHLAHSVPVEVDRARRAFENISFHKSVSMSNRLKVESISCVSTKVGFTCFDWFQLSPKHSMMLSIEFIMYLLLLIQAAYYLGLADFLYDF